MYVLRLHCKDTPGIVADVAACLRDNDCNIEGSAQFNDHMSGHFFMRAVYVPQQDNAYSSFLSEFEEIAARYDMDWQIDDLTRPVKTLLMVSKTDHCLNDILYRWRTDHLNIDITGVVSNHEDNRELTEERGLPFHYIPVEKGGKAQAESQLRGLIEKTQSELIVLARYMQILSDEMCRDYEGRIINIHHSFLPGFKGAKPYHQAYERGVKIIGATAHFATADLDEGPIIEQQTCRIDHRDTPKTMQQLGRDNEAQVLSRAIDLYAQRRIFLHAGRTVIL